jgi:hypothetical protein
MRVQEIANIRVSLCREPSEFSQTITATVRMFGPIMKLEALSKFSSETAGR